MTPFEAYEKALEEGPSDDTRSAACRDAWYAYRYALNVDRGPRDDTRRKTHRDPMCAYLYARDIDKRPHDATRAAASQDPHWKSIYEEDFPESKPTNEEIMAIVVNPFATRQSSTDWSEIPPDQLVQRVFANIHAKKKGYRDGVLLVPIDPSNIRCGTVTLSEDTPLRATYRRRKADEAPRKGVVALLPRQPAVACDVVLYASSVLAEDNGNTIDAVSGNWEIIAVLGRSTTDPEPMMPDTLMYNHFHVPGSDDGGTTTNMTDKEFVKALKESFLYWRNKATVGDP